MCGRNDDSILRDSGKSRGCWQEWPVLAGVTVRWPDLTTVEGRCGFWNAFWNLRQRPGGSWSFCLPVIEQDVLLLDLASVYLSALKTPATPHAGCLNRLTGLQWDFPSGSMEKNPPAMQETQVRSLGQEDSLEKEMAPHSSVLAWRIPWIPWTEEPGGLQFIASQRIRHD